MKRLPLHDLHISLGARMTTYANIELPLFYESIITEHKQVRISSGIMDISFLGKIAIRGDKRKEFLESLTTRPLKKVETGKVLYSLMLKSDGNIFADMLIFNLADHLLVTLNPLTTEKSLAYMKSEKPSDIQIEDVTDKLAILSVQGRKSAHALQPVTDMNLHNLAHSRVCEAFVGDTEGFISRTSYTGEDGFEIIVPDKDASALWNRIMNAGGKEFIAPIGVGARNTLRIEATFPLYGHEIDETTNPLEADLSFAVDFKHNFVGKEALLKIKKNGLKRKIAALVVESPLVARDNYPIYYGGKLIGHITRGTPSPTLRKNIALAYLPVKLARLGKIVDIKIRGRFVSARVVKRPFYIRKKQVNAQ